MADKFQLKALITGVDQLSPKLKGIQANVATMRKTLKTSGQGISLLEAGMIAAPFIAATTAAMQFESAMADVKKVVNFEAPQQFGRMAKDVRDLSLRLPMAAKDIAAIEAAGGQAGIERSGLGVFAEDAVKMGVAFDMAASEVGQAMAQWRTGFKMNQDQVRALADQINYLGNNGPANARKISAIVTRIGPLGAVAGVASGQIAALGATISGMGIEEEIAATGIKNFMLTLTSGASATKAQKKMFQALRLDAKKLAVDMQHDAKGTMMRVLQHIAAVDKSKQAAVLTELFGKENVASLAPLLTNLDLLAKNFDRVSDASQYAGSMEQEYASRAETSANNMELFKNRVMDTGIALGNGLLPALNDTMGALAPIITSVAQVIEHNPKLISTILGAATAFYGYKAAVSAAQIATELFSGALKISPLGVAVAAVGALAVNWEKVAAAAGQATAANKLAIASADQAAMDGDPNSIRESIAEVEKRLADLRARRKQWDIDHAGDLTVDRDAAMKRFDDDEKDTVKTLGKLKKTKRNAEILQADDAMALLPESQRGSGPAPVSSPPPSLSGGSGGGASGAGGKSAGGGVPMVSTQKGKDGKIEVVFSNMPEGARVDTKGAEGVKVTVKQATGKRSLSQ